MKAEREYPKFLTHDNSYGQCPCGRDWYVWPPGFPASASIAKHRIIQNRDGTITVSPSILLTTGTSKGEVTWHGHLVNGEFIPC